MFQEKNISRLFNIHIFESRKWNNFVSSIKYKTFLSEYPLPPPSPLPSISRQYSNLNPTQTAGWNLKPLLIGCLLNLHSSSGGNMYRRLVIGRLKFKFEFHPSGGQGWYYDDARYKQRSVMPLAECVDGVRGRMAGQYITLIRLVTEYLVSTPLTSRQPFTPTALTICWWLLLFLLTNKHCHWSSSNSHFQSRNNAKLKKRFSWSFTTLWV